MSEFCTTSFTHWASCLSPFEVAISSLACTRIECYQSLAFWISISSFTDSPSSMAHVRNRCYQSIYRSIRWLIMSSSRLQFPFADSH
jgi:hypothetical protein